MPAVLGGHVDMGGAPPNAVGSHLKSGTIRALAMIFSKRSQFFPDVPTLVDQGYPVTYSGFFGLMGPKGLPADVVQTLERTSARALQDYRKEIEDKYDKLGIDFAYLNSADFTKELQTQREITKKIVDELQKSGK